MLAKELKRDLKDMTRCKEFYFALLASCALVFGSLFYSLFSFYGKDIAYLLPAYVYWGLVGSAIPDMTPNFCTNYVFLVMVLPFLSALAYAFHCFNNKRNGAAEVAISRAGRKSYYLSNLFASFLGAFIIVLVPLVLEQVVLLICFPVNTPYMITDDPTRDIYLHLFGNHVGGSFAAFQLNHPYLYNLFFCLVPAIIAGLFGAVSFSLSLWIRKSRILVLTLPGIVWLAIHSAAPLFLDYNNSPEQAFLPFGNIAVFPVEAGILAAISLGLLAIHIHAVKHAGGTLTEGGLQS